MTSRFHCLVLSFACLQWFSAGLSAQQDGKHLFILSGQSNMAGLKPAESFTPTVEKEFGQKNVIVVHDAHGGQPIRRWYKKWKPESGEAPKSTGDLYNRLLKKVKAATKDHKIASVTFLWMQGERDAREKHGGVYLASLKGLREQIKLDLNRDQIYFVVGRLSDFDMQNKRYPHWTKIRQVQVQFAEQNDRTLWVDTDDLNDGLNRRGKEIKNDLHYSATGYKVFGSRLAEQAIKLIKGQQSQTPKAEKVTDDLPEYVVWRADDQLTAPKPDRVVLYKSIGEVKLNLHIFHPADHQATDSRPAIVFFFGGGWVGGTPKQFYKQSRYLAMRGMVAICAEYRIRSKHKTTPVECVKDGKSAIRIVRSKAKGWGIDPKRIAAGGGSAGGHVAAATGTLSKFDEQTDALDISCRPNALVLFNPVYDNSQQGYGYDRVKEYWKDISPMHNLSKATPPTIVFLGTKDKLIPVSTAKTYQSKLDKLNVQNELHLYENQPHGFFNKGESFLDTVEKMDKFLTGLGYLQGQPSIRKLMPAAAKTKPRQNKK